MSSTSIPRSPVSIDNALRAFAIEVHQLAYTLPSGHENELIRLSQRMLRRADEETQRRATGE